MALEIEGELTKINQAQTGQGQKSEWIKQSFVIETKEQYSKQICFTAWNDKAEALKNVKIGMDLKVHFNAESREYNEKWYTDLVVWKIDIIASMDALKYLNAKKNEVKKDVETKKEVVKVEYTNEFLPDANGQGSEEDLPF